MRSMNTARMVDKLGERFGCPVVETPVGFKRLSIKMTELDALIAGEESAGFGFRGHIPERDGILSGLMMLDCLTQTKLAPSQLLAELQEMVGPHEYDRVDITLRPDEHEEIRARVAGADHPRRVAAATRQVAGPVCVVSSGETTVTVSGRGRGGRNQELALAAASEMSRLGTAAVLASVGTDGVDGPTDAAGALVDSSTPVRAEALALAPAATYLAENDAYTYFDRLGDLIRTGPTGTNVGDLQVVVTAGSE